MARKPTHPPGSRTDKPTPPSAPSTQHHIPSTWRTVTSRLLPLSDEDLRANTPRREVPEIRLSGLWLERVGFPKGQRYLISADLDFASIYLQADPPPKARRRR